LLDTLYGAIAIPEAVYQEIIIKGAGRPGAAEVARASWIIRLQTQGQETVSQLLSAGLNVDESEALALALELAATLLIETSAMPAGSPANTSFQSPAWPGYTH